MIITFFSGDLECLGGDTLKNIHGWNVHILILKSNDPVPTGAEQLYSKLLERLGSFSDPMDALQRAVAAESEGKGLSIRSVLAESPKTFILELISHFPDSGPILATPLVRSPAELTSCLTVLNWIRNEAANFPALKRALKVFPILSENAAPQIREELLKYPDITGLFLANENGELRLLDQKSLTEDWIAPVSYLENQGKSQFESFRNIHKLPDTMSLSAWIPDLDAGAKLAFYQTTNRMPPEDLGGTAAMFFAMEEMGQVDKSQLVFSVTDAENAVLGIRERESGSLLGVVLISGGSPERLSQDAFYALGSDLQNLFKAGAFHQNRVVREGDQYVSVRETLSSIASDCCALALENHLQGKKAHLEIIQNPNEPSKTAQIGGTQSFVILNGSGFSFCMHMAFFEGNLKDVVSQVLKLPLEHTTVEVIRDFFREYLNQAIGWTQKALGKQGVRIKLGIPLTITAEDVVPSFLKSQTYDLGFVFSVEKFRFEIRISTLIEDAAEILHLQRQDTRKAITSANEEIDIDALFEARESLPSAVDQVLSGLGEFRRTHSIPPEVSISGWIPDAESGAKLQFFSTRNQIAPDELFGTAAMFFAMEEMGQVDTAEFGHQIQDETNVLVSVREKPMGRILGLLLFVGDHADQVPASAIIEFLKKYKPAFLSETQPTQKLARTVDLFSSTRSAITQIALDACLLRLESYIPGRKSLKEDRVDPNESSRALQTGGTQSTCILSGSGISILFNLIYLEGNLKDLVGESLKLPQDKVSLDVIRDYFREYLNQVVGWAQKVLGHQNLSTKIGFPLTIPSETLPPSFLRDAIYDGACFLNIDRYRFELRVSVNIAEGAEIPKIVAKNIQETLETAKEEVDIEALLDAM